MAIHASLRRGLEAFHSGEYADAAEVLRGVEASANDQPLVTALVHLSLALGTDLTAERDAASEHLARGQAELDRLPGPALGVDIDPLRGALRRPVAELVADPPVVSSASRLARAGSRFALFALLLGGVAAALFLTPLGEKLTEDNLIAFFEVLRQSWWAPVVLIAATAVGAPLAIPLTPFIVTGGVVFGAGAGGIYNAIGAILGAALSFELAHHLGRDLIVHLAGDRLRRFERRIARQGFWALVGIRFLPVPFPVVNFGAALAGVPRGTYLITTAIGVTPALMVYTYLWASIFELTRRGASRQELFEVGLLFVLVIGIAILPALVQGLARRRRYREIVARRRGGRSGKP